MATPKWEKVSRQGLTAASTATSVGFTAAKTGTKLGFGIARGITSTIASALGHPFGVGPALGGAVSLAFNVVEQVALAPILLGESLTSTSLVAAESSIDVLGNIFPGSDEASFSLVSFIALVKREWNNPAMREQLPATKYSATEIGKAVIAWAALQGVTYEWKQREWFKVLKELDVNNLEDHPEVQARTESMINITEDRVFPGDFGKILAADIGEAASPPTEAFSSFRQTPAPSGGPHDKLKSNLRRLSKMVLAGYGGAGLIFFGVSLTPPPPTETNVQASEERVLTDAVDASEREASSTLHNRAPAPEGPEAGSKSYSWWNVLLGRHDKDIFEGYAFSPATVNERGKGKEKAPTATIGAEKRTPRYWVLTDHARQQVVLVFRGTMSLNELAVDLTCDPVSFCPAMPDAQSVVSMNAEVKEDKEEEWSYTMPGSLPFGRLSLPPSPEQEEAPKLIEANEEEVEERDEDEEHPERYNVHGGILRMAAVMGAKGKPVHRAVKHALAKNKNYELVLCGHSLGAGVASLLALTWADPKTCLTVRASGLPRGRKVSVYCFAPPCLVSPALSILSRSMITSFAYSHDIVTRLSLGSVRDMNRVTAWLCEANKGKGEEGYTAVTKRALKSRAGYGDADDADWFLSIRKTLEANMQMADLFPPGRVLWAVRDGHLHPSLRLPSDSALEGTTRKDLEERVRLFEVSDVEKMFGQIVFERDMLSSHLPHQYDRVLHELL